MSFDVYIGDWDGNYTSNMGAFFAWAIHGVETAEPTARCDSRDAIMGRPARDGLRALDGATVASVRVALCNAFERIEAAAPGSLERFNAPNGWGSAEGATNFLRRMARACADAPDECVVRVWY